MARPILQLQDITLSFKGTKVLSSLSFSVLKGEICALIGPNGAGKSSLVNIITGLYRPNAGELLFEGKRLTRLSPRMAARHGIGRTFQHNALFDRMTVLENVLAGITRHSRTWLVEHAFQLPRYRNEDRNFRQQACEIIEILDLTKYQSSVISTLPYGVQKRVDLARALVARPSLLLLDEPLAGMNREEKRRMARFIANANQNLGTTIVLIEHDIGMVMDLSDHVVVLDYGRKVGDGKPGEVRKNPDVIAAYIGAVHQGGL